VRSRKKTGKSAASSWICFIFSAIAIMGPSYSPLPRRQGGRIGVGVPALPQLGPGIQEWDPFKTASGFAGLHIIALPTGKRECIISVAASAPGVRDVESKK
jgi:hypothetical protein